MIFWINLLVTIVTELVAATFFGIRSTLNRLLIIAMNMITNTLLQLVVAIFYRLTASYSGTWAFTLVMELLVVYVEMLFIKKELDYERSAWKLSAALNLSSFLMGLVVGYVRYGHVF